MDEIRVVSTVGMNTIPSIFFVNITKYTTPKNPITVIIAVTIANA
jgi:hypothetical protein